jgi:hypothetical protein
MIRSVLLYAAEVQIFSDAQLRTFEVFQSRCLRKIAASPSHIHQVSNYDIRESLEVPSISSYLRHSRLRWWRKLCDDDGALIGVRNAIFGSFSWDTEAPNRFTSPRIKLFLSDLKHLNQVLPTTLQVDFLCDFTSITEEVINWFVRVPASRIKAVESYFSNVERIYNRMVGPSNEPLHACPQCEAKFDTVSKLATHRWSKHRYRPATTNAILFPKCPVCSMNFASIKNAQNHFINKCSKHLTDEQLDNLSKAADLHRLHAASVGSNGNQLIYVSLSQAAVRL